MIKSGLIAIVLLSTMQIHAAAPVSSSVENQLDLLRGEIGRLENELLSTKTQNFSASVQLSKIRKLLELQKKEIKLSELRVKEYTRRLLSLSDQKQGLLDTISSQKKQLYKRLLELNKLTEYEPLDATFIDRIDVYSQREGYLANLAKKDASLVERLKQNADDALALELKIIEEKNELEYYVQELKEQTSMMTANEQIQREILVTNRTSRLEVMKNLKELKSAEKELSNMLSTLNRRSVLGSAGILKLKGKLPLPVKGTIISGFGRSYNERTNLFTFQKGIMIETRNGEEVLAVADGKVAYSGPLKHYGQIVILEHMGQYFTLYGQLSEASVKTGVSILQGDKLGKAAKDPVYFEIRNKNIAINPLQWLTGGVALSKFTKQQQ